MKIGIIGAQSKHVELFGQLFNQHKLFEGTSITGIWGGDASQDRIEECMQTVAIDTAYESAEELIEHSDGIIVALRDGSLHSKYAIACLNQKKPVFVDKPFTIQISDAQSIIKASHINTTPFIGGSTLCFLPPIPELREKASAASEIHISYFADPDSPFGGWPFYGSHLTDLCATICGTAATEVTAERIDNHINVEVIYSNKKVRISSAPIIVSPTVNLDGSIFTLDDKNCYEYGMKAFHSMLQENKNPIEDRLLFSVALMSAIISSLESGKPTSIAY